MPSWRNARVVSVIFSVGKSAKQIEMSIAVMISSVMAWNRSTSKVSSSRRNFSRLMLARLHEELSRWTYSEHGLLAVIRPDSGQVCQSLIVSSYWIPGSAHSHAAAAIWRNRSLALTVLTTSPVCLASRSKSWSSSTACMNSSETRTELLAFWYWTLLMSLPPRSMSKPASRSTRIFSSSRALVSMNSSTSGWSTSSTTIFAARGEQFPARPDPRQVDPRTRAALEDQALLAIPVEYGLHRVVDRKDKARGHLPRRRCPDIEPNWGIKAKYLMNKGMR